MDVPPTTAQTELDTTNRQTPNNNGQSASSNPHKQEFTYKLRKYILLLASLVATVTYAAGFSPPGDVWQDTAAGHLAGDPIIRDTHYKRYVAFFYCNATAFAASLVVIVLVLILSSLDDKVSKQDKYSNSMIGGQYWETPRIAVLTLQVAMVVDLISLMAAYAVGTCRDTFTTVYSTVLVGFVFIYVVAQVALPYWPHASPTPTPTPTPAPAAWAKASGNANSGSSSGIPQLEAVEKGGERQKPEQRLRKARMLLATFEAGTKLVLLQNKVQQRARKVLMLLATFAVSITYLAGLSTPGGFWDTAGAGHSPGDAILKDRHNLRLAVFLVFNTLAFVASLLIIVVLLDTKPHHSLRHGFIVVVLLSLIVAYNAGSCRQIDTTVYVGSLIGAVLLYISFLYFVADHIHATWKAMANLFKKMANLFIRKKAEAYHQEQESTEKEEAAKKARSLVLLLATLAATITYQAGLDPPGGVWQDNSGGHTAGDPILLTTNHRRYKAFFYCNSVSLVASLVAMVPVKNNKLLLKHHVLEAVMILDLFGLIGAYAAGSCRDVNTSIHAMALAGAVLVYVVIHVIFITLNDDTRIKSDSEKEKDNDLVEKKRKRLLLFAIFAATITYQAGLTPPGGFLLQDDDQSGHHAGDPVLLYNYPRRYKAFFYCNSVSFMLSIALIILLVNPKLYRPAIRTHALSVCTAVGLFGLMGAFAAGSTQHLKTSIYIFALVAVVIFFIILLFLVFLFTGCSSSRTPGQGSSDGPGIEIDSLEDKKKIENDEHKYLMLLGILVASVTYQAGLKPPGGAWQNNREWYEAGDPVMHDNRRHRYLAFFYSNSTSFMASIVVILLLLVRREKLIGIFGKNRLTLRLIKKIIGTNNDERERRKKWHVVMNTTIVLDLLGLLGAYAAGSSRRWKTSVYVLLLVIGVLLYMGLHLLLSCIIIRRSQSAQLTASPPRNQSTQLTASPPQNQIAQLTASPPPEV